MAQEEKKFNVDECNDVGILKGRIMFLESNMGCLSHQIGGYKTTNENYRKKVAELKERIAHYKNLDLEGDMLYEKALADIDAKNKVIEGLHSQVTELSNKVNELNDEKVKLKAENIDLDIALKYEQLPWWKKIF